MNFLEKKFIRYFINEHLSVERSIPFAIDWFFEEVRCGIVLEDDCVVHSGAFENLAMNISKVENSELIHVNLHHKLAVDFKDNCHARLDRVKLIDVWGSISNLVTWKTVRYSENVNLFNYLRAFHDTNISKYHLIIFLFFIPSK